MSKQCGIWIDGHKAILVHLENGSEKVTEITSNIEDRIHHVHEGDKGSFFGARHINNEKKFDERKRHQTRNFVEQVLKSAGLADDIYVLGPSGMKTRLKTAMKNEPALLKKLRGVKSTGSLTEAQLKANVRAFFDGES
jgi:hypothetical protein